MARMAGVSSDTIKRVKKLAASMDEETKNPTLKIPLPTYI